MIDTIKGILLIFCLSYGLVCMTKIINIINIINIANKKYTILESIRDLDEEDFLNWSIIFLNSKGFTISKKVDKNILKCTNVNKEYIVFLDNTFEVLDKEDGNLFYGYMLMENVDNLMILTTGKIKNELIVFLNSIGGIDINYYDQNKLDKAYKKFIQTI